MLSRIVKDADVLSGSVLAALGVYIIVEASQWTAYNAGGPGPGFFPIWYGLAIVGLSLALVAGKILSGKEAEGTGIDWSGAPRVLGTWAMFTVAAALLQPLGFVLSFGLLTFLLVTVTFRQSLLTALLTATGCTGLFYLIFPLALGVSLPTGPFGAF
jgi:putative tricarboxylic transport membrane protein